LLSLFVVAPLVWAAPVTSHPRLWLRAEDIARLRSWAVATNPVWENGLLRLAERAKADMDARLVPEGDTGAVTYVEYPAEMYAELFAFMSLVSPDAAARDDYGRRARTCLMYVMERAAKGVAGGEPFRDPDFAVSDRSRWHGEGFALALDWAYGYFSAADKATIRQVFLRWADEDTHAATTNFNHPEPIGVFNDPALLKDRIAVRWSANNYYTAHMRNIGLMAMAFDPADDPGGTLGAYLRSATGAWLYVVDSLLRNDSRGGLAAEGFEYSPQSLGYVLQFLLALRTAGQDDPAAWGPQVVLTGNPFWKDLVGAYLHSLSPATVVYPTFGSVYQPAWYGPAQDYWAGDPIQTFGPLGVYDHAAGNAPRLEAVRWIETNVPPGGAADLVRERVARADNFRDAICYFLLFDPAAAVPADPRPAQALTFFAPGLARLFARTDWGTGASWFVYALSWNSIDHQNADGNHFAFYRRGEWLTKQRTGYDVDYSASDNHNTVALENDRPNRDADDYRTMLWRRGSQWLYTAAGDPTLLASSFGRDFAYAMGDATPLYNSDYESTTDITHASRSIVWLSPDHIVVYDRAASRTANRFKRFWLNLPAQATVSGNRAVMASPKGQRLTVTTLLPSGAAPVSEPAPQEASGPPANQEPMSYRLRVDAPGNPATARFLHVLQGSDTAADADAVTLVQSSAGTPFAGAVVRATAVLFPVDAAAAFTSVTYSVPAGTTRHLITGLRAGASYDVATQTAGADLQVTVRPGSAYSADTGGVLDWSAAVQTLTTLYFPRLAASDGTAPGADTSEHTGIAIANLDSAPARLTLTAFDTSGAAMSGSSVTNPGFLELRPGEQVPKVDTEVFGAGIAQQNRPGWFRVESTARKVAGFFLIFNNSLTILDGADAATGTLASMIFPEVEDAGFTELHLVNPGAERADATIEVVDSGGSVRSTVTRSIAARGAVDERLTSLFPSLAAAPSDYVRVSATRGLVGYEYLGRAGRYVQGLNGQDTAGGAATLFSPQYVVGGADYRSALSIVNLESSPSTVTLRFLGDDGSPLGAAQSRTIPARGKLYVADQRFFLDAGGTTRQGYVEIKSSGPRLAGSAVFGDPQQSTFSTALPLSAGQATAFVFGQVASNSTYFTGVALLNSGAAAAAVRIDVCDAAGAVIASRTDTLAAGSRRAQLLTQLFPNLGDRASGYLKVTSDRPITGFALFGTTNLTVLSAIPPQVY
jgi:hypothetical protein